MKEIHGEADGGWSKARMNQLSCSTTMSHYKLSILITILYQYTNPGMGKGGAHNSGSAGNSNITFSIAMPETVKLIAIHPLIKRGFTVTIATSPTLSYRSCF